MNKPKWQRARIIAQHRHPEDIGKLLWISDTYRGDGLEIDDDTLVVCDVLMTNIIYSDHRRIGYGRAFIELLARGPEDFAADVPLVPWEQWLRESTPAKS